MHLYKFCQCVQWFGIFGPEFMFQHVPAIAFTLAKNIPISIDSNGDKLEWHHPRSHRFSRETWVELLSWVWWRAENDVMWLHMVHFAQGVRECCYPVCSSRYNADDLPGRLTWLKAHLWAIWWMLQMMDVWPCLSSSGISCEMKSSHVRPKRGDSRWTQNLEPEDGQTILWWWKGGSGVIKSWIT